MLRFHTAIILLLMHGLETEACDVSGYLNCVNDFTNTYDSATSGLNIHYNQDELLQMCSAFGQSSSCAEEKIEGCSKDVVHTWRTLVDTFDFLCSQSSIQGLITVDNEYSFPRGELLPTEVHLLPHPKNDNWNQKHVVTRPENQACAQSPSLQSEITSCSATMQTGISNAGSDTDYTCRVIQEYMLCVFHVTKKECGEELANWTRAMINASLRFSMEALDCAPVEVPVDGSTSCDSRALLTCLNDFFELYPDANSISPILTRSQLLQLCRNFDSTRACGNPIIPHCVQDAQLVLEWETLDATFLHLCSQTSIDVITSEKSQACVGKPSLQTAISQCTDRSGLYGSNFTGLACRGMTLYSDCVLQAVMAECDKDLVDWHRGMLTSSLSPSRHVMHCKLEVTGNGAEPITSKGTSMMPVMFLMFLVASTSLSQIY